MRRPADVNARAVMIAKIATGDVEDRVPGLPLLDRQREIVFAAFGGVGTHLG
jgi:hypothetical protein